MMDFSYKDGNPQEYLRGKVQKMRIDGNEIDWDDAKAIKKAGSTGVYESK